MNGPECLPVIPQWSRYLRLGRIALSNREDAKAKKAVGQTGLMALLDEDDLLLYARQASQECSELVPIVARAGGDRMRTMMMRVLMDKSNGMDDQRGKLVPPILFYLEKFPWGEVER